MGSRARKLNGGWGSREACSPAQERSTRRAASALDPLDALPAAQRTRRPLPSPLSGQRLRARRDFGARCDVHALCRAERCLPVLISAPPCPRRRASSRPAVTASCSIGSVAWALSTRMWATRRRWRPVWRAVVSGCPTPFARANSALRPTRTRTVRAPPGLPRSTGLYSPAFARRSSRTRA